MILFREVSKNFGKLEALKDFNLNISDGELFALVGPNGAGKTTTLRILMGALRPSSGEVFVKGKSLLREPIEAKRIMGYLPEEPNLYERMTPREYLRFFSDLYGAGRERIDYLLEQMGMIEKADIKISTFSKGMRQRIAISRTLLHDPEIIVLDEPTMGLDPITARELREFIAEQKGRKTVLLCTHYLFEAELLADRIGILNNGRLVAIGTPDELRKESGKDNLEDVFFYFVRGGS